MSDHSIVGADIAAFRHAFLSGRYTPGAGGDRRHGRPAPFAYVCTPNSVHVVNYERGEPRFRAGIDGSWLRLCDSRVVARLAAALLGVRLPLALGSDLTVEMVKRAIRPDDAITIIGGTDEMERRLRIPVRLAEPWPGTTRLSASSPTRRRPRAASISFWPIRPATCFWPAGAAIGDAGPADRRARRRGGHRAVHRRLPPLRDRAGAARAAGHAARRPGMAASPGAAAGPDERARLRKSQLPILWLALRYRLARH